jgi:coenzyme F420-0:L-glutamate ligase/coenzyme F420-1:gamma-L-glutamate ligase
MFMKVFTAVALEGFPMIGPGDDVARAIVESSEENGTKIDNGDVIVAAQKIFSKAERRVVKLGDIVPSKRARQLSKTTGKGAKFVQLVLTETREMLKACREVLLVRDKRGLVCINAGIDKSNVEGTDNFALLPRNPDGSAENCRTRIEKLTGRQVAVIICDTYSRPFRRGQVNFAIGVAGINPFRDYRGKADLFGQILKVKNVAVVDEIAAAAELLMGQGAEARPVVILKGLGDMIKSCERCSVDELLISKEEDLFKGIL